MAWLVHKYPYEIDDPMGRWASLQDPLTAAQVEDGDFTWMRTWTEAQRRRYNMQKKLMEAGPEVRSVLKGLLAVPPRDGLDFEQHVFKPLMKGDWAAFEAAWKEDHAPKKDVSKEAEAGQPAEAGLTADQEEDEKREKTLRDAEEVAHAAKKLAHDKEVATEATQRVNQLFVPIVPTVSSEDALVSLVKTQHLRAGPHSSMLAFWYTKGDREQAVYPGQNRYARDAPCPRPTSKLGSTWSETS